MSRVLDQEWQQAISILLTSGGYICGLVFTVFPNLISLLRVVLIVSMSSGFNLSTPARKASFHSCTGDLYIRVEHLLLDLLHEDTLVVKAKPRRFALNGRARRLAVETGTTDVEDEQMR